MNTLNESVTLNIQLIETLSRSSPYARIAQIEIQRAKTLLKAHDVESAFRYAKLALHALQTVTVL